MHKRGIPQAVNEAVKLRVHPAIGIYTPVSELSCDKRKVDLFIHTKTTININFRLKMLQFHKTN